MACALSALATTYGIYRIIVIFIMIVALVFQSGTIKNCSCARRKSVDLGMIVNCGYTRYYNVPWKRRVVKTIKWRIIPLMTLSFSESPAILKVGSMATYDGYGSKSSQLENHALFCQSHACAHELKWRMHNNHLMWKRWMEGPHMLCLL